MEHGLTDWGELPMPGEQSALLASGPRGADIRVGVDGAPGGPSCTRISARHAGSDTSAPVPSLSAGRPGPGIVGPSPLHARVPGPGALRRASTPDERAVSALEAAPHGWVQQSNFLIFAALTFAQAVGLHRWASGPGRGEAVAHRSAALSVAVGLVVAAVFPLREDAAGATL